MDKLLIVTIILISFSTNAANDPTRPLFGNLPTKQSIKTEKKSSQQTLTAIFKKNGKRMAIIGDKIYRVGDRYHNTKIVSIRANSVLLEGANGSRKLTLIPKIKSK